MPTPGWSRAPNDGKLRGRDSTSWPLAPPIGAMTVARGGIGCIGPTSGGCCGAAALATWEGRDICTNAKRGGTECEKWADRGAIKHGLCSRHKGDQDTPHNSCRAKAKLTHCCCKLMMVLFCSMIWSSLSQEGGEGATGKLRVGGGRPECASHKSQDATTARRRRCVPPPACLVPGRLTLH